ncbi:MAG: hypothetical protein GF364_02335 [Candidatus Lokiarchaeota archaeon]|nr:hypothetical protein [Candidatus Lokiarchaeota archaeon]
MAKKKGTTRKTKKRKGTKKSKTRRPKSSTEKEYIYVFDANFFISLKHIKATQPLKHLKEAKEEIGIKYYISDLVYNELPFYKRSRSTKFKDTVEVKEISEQSIQWVKDDLSNLGIKESRHAQDPDLSLISLCKKLLNKNKRIFLVSDDFKLGENLKILGYPIEYQSLSAFLLFLAKNSKTPELRMYFSSIQKKTLKYNLEYMLERKEIYNPVNKLMFLIENSIEISNEGFDLTSIDASINDKSSSQSRFQNVCIDDIDGKDETTARIQNLCNNYILSKKVDELDEIILMLPLLDDIKKSRRYLAAAKESLKEDQTEQAIKSLKAATNQLMNSLQLAGSILPKNQYSIFQKVVTNELSNCEFLRAFLYIGLDKLDASIEALNATATYATIGRTKRSAMAINYLKALIFTFNGLYDDAIEQYRFTEALATNYAASKQLILKCSIGRAITMFLAGLESESLELINKINNETQEGNLENAIIVFQELGDYFYAIGNPKISIALYREALECAVDSDNFKWKVNSILNNMKRAYMNAMLEGLIYDDTTNVDSIIDQAHELKNFDDFNDAIGQLAEFNAMMYRDMEYTKTGETIDYFKLDEHMREKFDVVDILEGGGNKTVLIAFNKNIGLIGFRTKLKMKLMGMPENYTVVLLKNAKVKIIKPSPKLKAKYLIRAIVAVTQEHIDIDRNIPVFFAQMNI